MISDISSILISINKLVGEECALPGGWSPKIFYEDLMNKPVMSSEVLVASMKKLTQNIQNEPSYLNWFEETRGYKKEVTEYQKELYTLFGKNSIMLYFEEIFIKMLNMKERNEILLQYIYILSQSSIDQWDSVVKKSGACCYQWYAKEHELYLALMTRKDEISYENKTDEQLFKGTKYKLEQIGQLTPNDSRSKLIDLIKNNSDKIKNVL